MDAFQLVTDSGYVPHQTAQYVMMGVSVLLAVVFAYFLIRKE